jgi:hypothetical protein
VVLNNPPKRPEIAIFDNGGVRLDVGRVEVNPGTQLVLRHSVSDFETPDDQIPFAALVLQLDDQSGDEVVLTGADSQVGQTQFDAGGPQGRGDVLNYRFTWNIPANNLTVRNSVNGQISVRPNLSGLNIRPLVVYIDGATPGIIAIESSLTLIEIQ